MDYLKSEVVLKHEAAQTHWWKMRPPWLIPSSSSLTLFPFFLLHEDMSLHIHIDQNYDIKRWPCVEPWHWVEHLQFGQLKHNNEEKVEERKEEQASAQKESST